MTGTGQVEVPGLTCMTLEALTFRTCAAGCCLPLEVPSVQSKEAWNSFLQLFSLGAKSCAGAVN